MQMEIDIVNVKIMDREFKIKCPKSKTQELQSAALYLDSRMRNFNKGDPSLNIDRLAIVTALNVTHELLAYRHHKYALIEHVRKLKSKIEKILAILP